MSSLENTSDNIKADRLLVKAAPLFFERRFLTINGLTKKQFKALRAGESVEIDKKHFNKELYIKDK